VTREDVLAGDSLTRANNKCSQRGTQDDRVPAPVTASFAADVPFFTAGFCCPCHNVVCSRGAGTPRQGFPVLACARTSFNVNVHLQWGLTLEEAEMQGGDITVWWQEAAPGESQPGDARAWGATDGWWGRSAVSTGASGSAGARGSCGWRQGIL